MDAGFQSGAVDYILDGNPDDGLVHPDTVGAKYLSDDPAVATMLRLALNLASTRLILADGYQGTAAAGRVIEAFGSFVVGGNYVIGIIIFAILVIVNFVVITKGAGRIAEVAARFSLDAMPGKQMAIDADLSAGLINEDQARQRRGALEEESTFYGAMDGASKFVRGDAIAGILITFINMVGGIVIGIAQQDMRLGQAAQTYTLLTVGDGLVTQIPALIVSTAAGMLVTKAGPQGSADKELLSQLGGYPTALALCTFLLLFIAILPSIPALPFLILAGLTGGFAYATYRRNFKAETERREIEAAEDAPAPRRRRADLNGTADRQRAPRTGIWTTVADQQPAGTPPYRSDQGASPATRNGDGLHHAGGAHSG